MRRNDGFTLVELLVAIFIFALGIVGVLALFTSAWKTGQIAQEETKAAMVAGSVVAELRSEVEAGQKVLAVADKTHPDFPRYKYSVDPVEMDEAGREFLVTVTVSWKRRGKPHSEVFRTILVRKQ